MTCKHACIFKGSSWKSSILWNEHYNSLKQYKSYWANTKYQWIIYLDSQQENKAICLLSVCYFGQTGTDNETDPLKTAGTMQKSWRFPTNKKQNTWWAWRATSSKKQRNQLKFKPSHEKHKGTKLYTQPNQKQSIGINTTKKKHITMIISKDRMGVVRIIK